MADIPPFKAIYEVISVLRSVSPGISTLIEKIAALRSVKISRRDITILKATGDSDS
ncbi:hypothetical protein D3C73_1320370 [compost metagenome]